MQVLCKVGVLGRYHIVLLACQAPVDKDFGLRHTEIKMQLSCVKLKDLRPGQRAILEHIGLPPDEARRLMELGFLPGAQVTAGHRAPGGDPRVFQVDGSEIALRAATAGQLTVRFV